MKKYSLTHNYNSILSIVAVCFMLALFNTPAQAAGNKTISISWDYSANATLFTLYKNGIQHCTSPDPTFYQMDCSIFIDGSGNPISFTMTATDINGIESPHSSPYILPTPVEDAYGNYLPIVALEASTTGGTAPLTVDFDASASTDVDGSIVNFDWSFGDGGSSAGSVTSYTFSAAGTYTVTLTIADNAGGMSTKSLTITVSPGAIPVNQPPIAVMTASVLVEGASHIAFDATASSDYDGTISSYSWNFGDGNTATGDYVEHTYASAGNYTATLTVVDDEGASSQDQMVITIVDTPNIPPTAVISASVTQKLIHLEWDYPTDDPSLTGFRFYQNDVLMCENTDSAARSMDCLTYVENGLMNFYLTAFNNIGDETTESEVFSFDATGIAPATLEGESPLTVYLNGTQSNDPDGTIVSYHWDFGDGNIANNASVEHIYNSPGIYLINLTVTDNDGSSHTSTEQCTVLSSAFPPLIESLMPNSLVSLESMSQNFIAKFSDANGYSNIQFADLLIHYTVSMTDGIYVRYDADNRTLNLFNDSGNNQSSCIIGENVFLENSQGAIDCSKSSVIEAEKNLTLNINVTPSTAFASGTAKRMYLRVIDEEGLRDGWTQIGPWTIQPSGTNTPPYLGPLSPSNLTSLVENTQTFQLSVGDEDGYDNLDMIDILINDNVNSANGIYVRYEAKTDTLTLYSDTGTTGNHCTPGENKTLSNSQGTLDCAVSNVNTADKNLILTLALTPHSFFAGATAKRIYARVIDNGGLRDGWALIGPWKINATPSVESLSPESLTSASGVTQHFTASYSDANGYENISTADFLINSKVSSVGGIYIRYQNSTNKLTLFNDAGDNVSSCSPGENLLLQNTQGNLNCATSNVDKIENNLILNLDITPSSSFSGEGAKRMYTRIIDIDGLRDGWVQIGPWEIVP